VGVGGGDGGGCGLGEGSGRDAVRGLNDEGVWGVVVGNMDGGNRWVRGGIWKGGVGGHLHVVALITVLYHPPLVGDLEHCNRK